MNRVTLHAIVVAGLTAVLASTSAAERPNVVLFLVDDLGWRDLGCQGSEYYQTPNIDALAASGVRFTDAYAACAVCSPTRAAILTGKYPARLMLTQWLPAGRWDPDKHAMREGRFLRSLPLEELTLAELLRDQGYATWHIGKWHLGGAPFSLPQHHGFEVNIAGDDHGAPGSYFFPFKGEWQLPTTETMIAKQAFEGGEEGDFLTDALTDEAVALVENRDTEKPFFLYFPYYAVHTPIQGKPDLVEKYEAVPKAKRQGNPGYAAMVESVDESVGRVMAALDAAGASDNTLVIFTSDNGGYAKATDNSPLRANKGSHYEGGIRVPLIFAGAQIGLEAPDGIGLPVHSCDLLPTILAFTGTPSLDSDGRNLAPLLTGLGEVRYDPEHPLFWHYPHYNRHPQNAPASAIRKGDWKLIEFLETGEVELYDLHKDLGESRDLSDAKPGVAAELLAELHAWKAEVGADPMRPNPVVATASVEGALNPFLGDPQLSIQPVFEGERFPNVVVTRAGTVLVTLGNKLLRARRSDDGGMTWGPEIVIARPGFQGGGTTVDEVSGDILVFAEAGHPPSPMTMYRSRDDGRTWAAETPTIHPNQRGDLPSMHMNEHGITLRHGEHAGRLIRPTRFYGAGNRPESIWPTHYTNAMFSDDGGRTWQTSEPFPENGTGEAAIAELSDGRLYYNSRVHWQERPKNTRRREAWSEDGGATWIDFRVIDALPDGQQTRSYGCMGGLVRLPVEGRDVLVFSNLDTDQPKRERATVWASFDGGKTWPVKRLVFEGPSAYSSLDAGRPGTASEGWIYLNFESEDKAKVARFNLSWLLGGEATGDGEVPADL